MSKVITLEGACAMTAAAMIAEASLKWPSLNQVTDEEAMSILIGSAITAEHGTEA